MPAACGTFRGAARGGFLGRYHVRHHVFGGLLSGLLVRYYTLGHVLGEGRLMSRHCYHGVYHTHCGGWRGMSLRYHVLLRRLRAFRGFSHVEIRSRVVTVFFSWAPQRA
jgi:hypothetical protein